MARMVMRPDYTTWADLIDEDVPGCGKKDGPWLAEWALKRGEMERETGLARRILEEILKFSGIKVEGLKASLKRKQVSGEGCLPCNHR